MAFPVLALFLLGLTGLFAFQANFRQYPNEEDNPAPVPPDAKSCHWFHLKIRTRSWTDPQAQ